MSADQPASWVSRHRGRLGLAGAALGAAAFVLGLAAQAPASLLAEHLPMDSGTYRLSGLVHKGQMLVDDGEVSWRMRPLATMASARMDAAWRFDSPDAQVSGRGSIANDIRLTDVSGRVGSDFLMRLSPEFAAGCAFSADVSASRLVITDDSLDIEGELRTTPGSCAERTLPSLLGVAHSENGEAVLRLWQDGSERTDPPLATARIARNGAARIDLMADGAELLTGRRPAGPSSIEILR